MQPWYLDASCFWLVDHFLVHPVLREPQTPSSGTTAGTRLFCASSLFACLIVQHCRNRALVCMEKDTLRPFCCCYARRNRARSCVRRVDSESGAFVHTVLWETKHQSMSPALHTRSELERWLS